MFVKHVKIAVSILAICMGSTVVFADEVMEAIQEATEAYNEKAYTEAVESLDYAKQLIQQMTSEGLKTFLPEPLAGWKAREAKLQNLGMMGGSAGIEQQYVHSSSGGRVTMVIMGESPMFQGMMQMFNPAVVGSTGGKLQKIKRNKAVVKYSAERRSGEIFINVAKKYLIKIDGSDVDKEDMMNYANAVDYRGLKSF
ncbi:MAG: hypothetical protein QNI89_00780 [Desulfobacterales bacterium]|nr:hypothetical protein [Desulfobacterales bacterium]